MKYSDYAFLIVIVLAAPHLDDLYVALLIALFAAIGVFAKSLEK